MNDKELADRVVALGVGNRGKFVDKSLREAGEASYFPPGGDWGMPAETFIGSPRVAMALMERCEAGSWYQLGSCTWEAEAEPLSGHPDEISRASGASLPRAIIEACVLALEAK